MVRGLAAGVVCLFGCGGPPAARHPSVVLVAMDTVRWDHTSLSGYSRDTTPNLARLAAAPGARTFDRAVSGAAWSLPSYVTILTGREVMSHGVGFKRGALDRAHATLPQVLAAYGYDTAAFTSGPHLDWATGLAQGFETYEHSVSMASLGRAVDGALAWVGERKGGDAPFFMFVHGYDAHPPIVVPAAVSELFEGGYEGRVHDVRHVRSPRLAQMPATRDAAMLDLVASPDRLRVQEDRLSEGVLLVENEAAWVRVRGGPRIEIPPGAARVALRAQVRRHGAEGPPVAGDGDAGSVGGGTLLANAGLGDALVEGDDGLVIDPALGVRVLGGEFSVTEADIAHYVAHYDAGVLTADYHFGRLLRGLEDDGVLDDAIVIALSDHGEALGQNGQLGHETEVGDAVFHVPLVVSMPDGLSPVRWDGVVSLADLLPTLTEVLGLTAPAGMTGTSFAAVLGPQPPPVNPAAQALSASMCCYEVRTAQWALRAARDPVPIGDGPVGFGRPRTADADAWGPWRWELYADGAGPDVAAEHPEVVSALGPSLDHWFKAPARRRGTRSVAHGNVQDRPDLVKALREGGYWTAEDRTAEDRAAEDRAGVVPATGGVEPNPADAAAPQGQSAGGTAQDAVRASPPSREGGQP